MPAFSTISCTAFKLSRKMSATSVEHREDFWSELEVTSFVGVVGFELEKIDVEEVMLGVLDIVKLEPENNDDVEGIVEELQV